jgi:hypothetical protein
MVTKRMNLQTTRRRLFLCELNLHSLRRLAIAVAGGGVVLVGIAMLVLPGHSGDHYTGIGDSGDGVSLGETLAKASKSQVSATSGKGGGLR